jgi:hypothetical protein
MLGMIIVCSKLNFMVEVGSCQRIGYFGLNFKKSFDFMSIRNLKHGYQNYAKKECQEFEGDRL